MTDEENFSGSFNQFLAALDKHSPKEKLFLLSGLVELLRHTKSATDVLYMAELLAAVPYVDWARIPFSITKALLSDKYSKVAQQLGVPDEHIPAVLQMALLMFLEETQAIAPAAPTEEMLHVAVTAISTSFLESIRPEDEPPNPKLPVVSPDVFNDRLVRRVFTPNPLTLDRAEKLNLRLVIYRRKLANLGMGPAVRGLAIYADDEKYSLLLETGEYVEEPKDSEHVVISTAPEDYKSLTASMLLSVCVASADAFRQLGKLHSMHFCAAADVDDLKTLERVFDTGREEARMGVTGATGPTGASVRFPVPATDMAVIVEARKDSYGPYSVARLVQTGPDGRDVVLMRHDTPRHYSVQGVYLFPLQDRLVSLIALI
jgi:hypothetical protein